MVSNINKKEYRSLGFEPMPGKGGCCPDCGEYLHCDCKYCFDKIPMGKKPFSWDESGWIIICQNCGYWDHSDFFVLWDMDCLEVEAEINGFDWFADYHDWQVSLRNGKERESKAGFCFVHGESFSARECYKCKNNLRHV